MRQSTLGLQRLPEEGTGFFYALIHHIPQPRRSGNSFKLYSNRIQHIQWGWDPSILWGEQELLSPLSLSHPITAAFPSLAEDITSGACSWQPVGLV